MAPDDRSPSPTGSARRAAVLAALAEDPGLDLGELSAATRLGLKQLAPLLWRMEDDGLVVHEGRRWFAVEA